jgi:hypothetical protein
MCQKEPVKPIHYGFILKKGIASPREFWQNAFLICQFWFITNKINNFGQLLKLAKINYKINSASIPSFAGGLFVLAKV